MNENNQKKTRKPRAKKFTTEQLNSVINEYANYKSDIVIFKKTDLCNFGNEHMKFENILKPYDFQRNKDINEKIDELNRRMLMPRTLKEGSNRKYVSFDLDVDYLVKELSDNKKRAEMVLNAFRTNTHRLKRMYQELEKNFKELEEKYTKETQLIDRYAHKIERLEEKNRKQAEKIKKFESYNFEKEVRFANMVQFLHDKKCFSEISELSRERLLEIYLSARQIDSKSKNFNDTEIFFKGYTYSIDGDRIIGLDPNGEYFEDSIKNIDKYSEKDEFFDDEKNFKEFKEQKNIFTEDDIF